LNVRIDGDLAAPALAALGAADPDASIFHDPDFLGALLDRYREFRPHHLVATDDAGRLLGVLPTIRVARSGAAQILSLPFGSYATPLVAAGDSESEARVRAELIRAWLHAATATGVVRAHFVSFPRTAPDMATALLPAEWRLPERTHLIPLEAGFDDIWFRRYDKENRTAARKAVRQGVVVGVESGEEAHVVLETLYRMQAREWTAHALYRYGLFAGLADRLGDRMRIWVARHEGEAVFAVLAFYHKDTVLPWVSGASPAARALCAGNLIHKVIIEDACRRGFAGYNFGGSGGVAGIEAFKVAFGGEAVDYASWFHEAPWFGRLRTLRRGLLRRLGRA
jgi:CelD/BcsL family acetyltransferase involved in cellulose biosynthesis